MANPPVARHLFDRFPRLTTDLWNTKIIGFIRNNMPDQAILLYARMLSSSTSLPDHFAYTSTLRACAETRQLGMKMRWKPNVLCFMELFRIIRDVRNANALYGLLITIGSEYAHDKFVVSTTVHVYSKLGELDSARKIFDQCLERSTVIRNSMIKAYVQNNRPVEALELFLEFAVKSDKHTCCPGR
ncbi:hypothetical protein POM88_038674 [Heracleum sosnowskyi]|uniref:Pentatricopeptide repeat-containing protein n=1 Tax=Heracleum sosnowskyi TaxID=360622 RepID=A0AAD8HAV0_9APIA|nr:hypothetical protein POM88_038674 [Heracleum sosnowskyi]